jgi:hypothetical protein
VDFYLDIADVSLNKQGEELCGDKVKVYKSDQKTIVVLSDGLGSGVKANILATLTAEIIVTLLKADVPLKEVMATVIGTLPICKVRQVAYATFTAIEVDHRANHFRVINFDNPSVLYFRRGHPEPLKTSTVKILERQISISEGDLQLDDFLGIISDGVLHAGLGTTWNFGWGWDNVVKHIENLFVYSRPRAEQLVQDVICKTETLYGGVPGDDATFVGLYTREKHSLMVLTGPPLDQNTDELYIQRLLDFSGRKAVCGGTTANIVADFLGEVVDIDISTLREDVPPIGYLSAVDLVTEGIITMAKALDMMRACEGRAIRLSRDGNAAALLAKELLTADSIDFLVGQQINEFYQNPLLPRNLSIRKNLVEEMCQFLRDHKKEVRVEYC